MNHKKIAIVQLCFADFESLEISLAAYVKLTTPDIHIYLLQNGRGTYDTERTYRVCQRYAKLYPKQITVVDWLAPNAPYLSIKALLNSDEMKQYDYICKVDDDVFPLTKTWIEDLIKCYEDSRKKYGKKLAYVTSLVNNNPWGFKQVVDLMKLKSEFDKISIAHYIGVKENVDSLEYRFVEKNVIHPGGAGSVWAVPHYARWIHQYTTLKPADFIKVTKGLGYKEVNNQERYSINCMLFKREFWNDIDIGHTDDEYQTYKYCKKENKKIIAAMNVPMCHIFFCTQREENKDMLGAIRQTYEDFWGLPFPIAICAMKEYETENRLRFIELRLIEGFRPKVFIKNKKSYPKYLYFKLLHLITFGKTSMKFKKKYKRYK